MNENELSILVDEMREEFQIPPYYDDRQLRNLAKEGEHAVGRLNPDCSITKDLTYRMLMKNYMYYSYHHRVSEFFENYASVILTWQMATEVDVNGTA